MFPNVYPLKASVTEAVILISQSNHYMNFFHM